MISLGRGTYQARLAKGAADISACQALRHLAFHGVAGRDVDAFDAACLHVMIETGTQLVACYRVLRIETGRDITKSYSAQFYDLTALEAFEAPMAEMGRFCVHPDHADADIIRVAWAALTRYVDQNGIKMLFGCSSFPGTHATEYADTFAILKARHLAPKRWLPKAKSKNILHYNYNLRDEINVKLGKLRMPPLLRTYLTMGGWVSDHAVVDLQMNTLHVFTGLEIAAIPPARARLLRAAAG